MKILAWRKAVVLMPLLISGVLFSLQSAWAEGKVLKAGVILPLSGEAASVGTAMRRGLELALAESRSSSIELRIEDDGSFNRLAAATAAHKLVDIDQVDLLLNSAMNTASVLAPILARRKTAGVIIWDSNRRLTQLPGQLYGTGYSTEGAGQGMADFAIGELGLRRIAVICAEDEWSEMIAEAFSSRLQSLGGEVVLHERTDVSETDFRALAARMRTLRIDAVYAPLFPGALAAFLRQARAGGLDAAVLSADGLLESVVKSAGASAEGVYATQAWFSPDSPLASRLGEKDPVDLAFAALGYDAGRLLLELARKIRISGASPDRESVLRCIPGLRFQGADGIVSFRRDRQSGRQEAIVVVRNSRLELFRRRVAE